MQKAVQLLSFSNILFFQKTFRILKHYNNKTEPTVSVRSQLVGEHGYSAKLGDDNVVCWSVLGNSCAGISDTFE